MISSTDLIQRYRQGERDFNSVALSQVNLTAADLKGIDLSYANLSGVNLAGADLRGSSLIGTDLRDTILQQTNLAEADYSPRLTRFPPDFHPEQAQMHRVIAVAL
ncbi:MAG: pentapeptide repeat-containing protein [Cyanobacteria bacterium J06632_22]